MRSHGKLQLTPAGRSLQQEWKNLINHFEDSLENAYSIQEGYAGKLRIGTGDLVENSSWIHDLIKQTKERHPNLDIDLEYHDLAQLTKRAINGQLDVIITSGHLREIMSDAGLSWDLAMKTNLAIFVHSSNPLYNKKSLSFSDLRTEKFIALSPSLDRSYMPLLMRLGRMAGFTPSISCYVPNDFSFKGNLSLGSGIVLADSETNLENDNVKKFVLEDEPNDLIYAWNPQNTKKGIKEFLTIMKHSKTV